MSDDEALAYISYLEKYEKGTSDDEYFESYAQFAATLAKDWRRMNPTESVSLGECLRAANTGLVIAANLHKKHGRRHQFRYYAKPIIISELDKLKS